MAIFKTFEEITAWQKSHALALELYQITNSSALAKDFALRDQMRRSAISIPSNIAEGHERNSDKQFCYFLNVAKASAGELRSQFRLAHDLGYIQSSDYNRLKEQSIEVSRLISGLMKYLKKA